MNINQRELREQLVQQLENAFADVKYEYPSWHENPLWQLQGKHWRETPIEMLKRNGFVFGLPRTEDGQFFLPAYILALLTQENELEGYDLKLLMALASDIETGFEAENDIPFAYLNSKQKGTLLTFIQAYPILFPNLFTIEHYPTDVKDALDDLISQIDSNMPSAHTPYEYWEKAVAFWKNAGENS
ncbi:MAG: hypothetical protein IPO91_04080 [Chloroflexi bacterium]|nr:hypothetical protein [Chloroflexota bacterium]